MTGYFSPSARGGRVDGRRWTQLLRFGPPLVSLTALIWAGQAMAQTTTNITTDTTAPLATSKAGDITVATGGSIKPPSGVAVTIDSNNSLTNAGIIQFRDKSDTTAVLLLGGHTGAVTNTNTIQNDDTSTTTTDSNGVVHGPFANGSNRFGIRLIGPGPFTGSITNGAGGVVTVRGDNSYGISAESDVVGSIVSAGSLNIQGTKSVGLRTTGLVSGDVTISGATTATGQGVQAINLGNDVGGALAISGAITSTGYRYTTRSTDAVSFAKLLSADDLLQSGAAVTVAGNVGKGILVNSVTTTDSAGVVSSVTGSINTFSAAPALVVGAVGRSVAVGDVGTGADAFGIELKGNVLASGVYDGITATGVQLGVAGGGAVTTGDGLRVGGTLGATAYAADATALHVNAGASVPVLRNDGAIASAVSTDAPGATSRAVLIEQGASVRSLLNATSISSSVTGQQASAAAIVDRSGTLVEVQNRGTISAGRTLTSTTLAVTGNAIALDLSANTSGVHIVQQTPTGATTAAAITGAVNLGSGGDRVEILGGKLTGDLDLGAGANTLTIDGGGAVKGALNAAGGTVALTVGVGSLTIDSASQLKLTSLSLGATSQTILTADPATGLATKLDVAGNATVASGAKIGLRLNSLLQGSATYTLVRADHLTTGAIDTSLLGAVPFLYKSSLQTDAAAGTITATLSRKTAAELALPTTSAGAYDALVVAVNKDLGLRGALLAQSDRAGLIGLYNQLLPNHSGSIFNVSAAAIDAFARPIDERQDARGGGFWIQEINLGLSAANRPDDPGYDGWSLGAIAGYELPATSLGIFGATFGASTNTIYPNKTDSSEDLHSNMIDGGVYWRASRGGFTLNAKVGADYLKVSSARVVEVLGGDGLAVNRRSTGQWSGYGLSTRVAASYEARFGRYYIRPIATIDYLRLMEGSYTEAGGGLGMDLAVNSRTSSRASVFAGVAVGATYGVDNSWGPEVLLGYKGVASEQLGVTTAKFVSGGDAFDLRAGSISGQGAAAHLSVKGENGSGGFAVEGGAETRDGLNIYDLRLAGHIQF